MIEAVWLGLVVLALTWTAYGHTLPAPFVLDDLEAVVDNPMLHGWWAETARTKETSLAGRPVVAVSMAANYLLGGLEPAGYHVVNIAWHLLNGWLLFRLLSISLSGPTVGDSIQRVAHWLAAAIVALWLLHPLQTESVTYITSRTELAVASFYLATLICAAHSWQPGREQLWSVLAVVCCALGMASKEVMVTAPVMVVAYDYVYSPLTWREILMRRWRLYAALAGTWLVLIPLMIMQPRSSSVGLGHGVTAWQYAAAQCEVVLTYARLSLWPVGLCFDYGFIFTPQPHWLALGAAGVVSLAALAAWGLWRRWWIGFLAAWPLLILAPTSSFVPIVTQVAAERRMYMPLAAVVVAVVLIGHWLISRFGGRSVRRQITVASVLCCTVLLLLTALSRQRNTLYLTPELLARDTLALRPDNSRAAWLLADWLVISGDKSRLEEAVGWYQRSLELNDGMSQVHNNLGHALAMLGRSEEAIASYRRALEIAPEYATCYESLAEELALVGQYDEARAMFERAIELTPNAESSNSKYGLFLVRRGESAAGLEKLSRAVELGNRQFVVLRDIGTALFELNRYEEAAAAFQTCVRQFPQNADGWYGLGTTLSLLGKYREALAAFETCLALAPHHGPARAERDSLRRQLSP